MSRKKQKAHFRDWNKHQDALILFAFGFTENTERTKCGIDDDFIPERDELATPVGEMNGFLKTPREELCRNCMATLHN